MIAPEEFVVRWKSGILINWRPDRESSEWWESNELVRYDPDIVNRLAIPESSRRFLIEAGLPRWTQRHLRFDFRPNTLPVMQEILHKFHLSDAYRRYRFVGKAQIPIAEGLAKTISFYCLDEQASGRVVNLKFSEGLPMTFVNSSIEQFAEFLLLLRQYTEWRLTEQDEIERQANKDELRSEFYDKAYEYGNQIVKQLEQADYPATEEGSMWEQNLLELKYGK